MSFIEQRIDEDSKTGTHWITVNPRSMSVIRAIHPRSPLQVRQKDLEISRAPQSSTIISGMIGRKGKAVPPGSRRRRGRRSLASLWVPQSRECKWQPDEALSRAGQMNHKKRPDPRTHSNGESAI
jgi:hypothetical protein